MRIILVVAVGALLGGFLPAEGHGDKQAMGLKGRWVSEKFVWAGQESEEDEKVILVIGDDSMTWTYWKEMGDAAKSSGNTYTYKRDESKKPAEIDLTITDGTLKDRTFPTIYQLEGNTLKLCRAQPGQKRPTEFASKKGSGTIFLILKRDK